MEELNKHINKEVICYIHCLQNIKRGWLKGLLVYDEEYGVYAILHDDNNFDGYKPNNTPRRFGWALQCGETVFNREYRSWVTIHPITSNLINYNTLNTIKHEFKIG
jgi:hypothetical protein